MNKPLVSIITLTYRKFDDLEKTLGSVMNQDYPRIEYIIADDGSDNFDEVLFDNYISTNKNENIESCVIIHQEKNVGTVKNYNNACRNAKGKYIIPLSMSDSFVSNNVITQIVEEIEKKKYNIMAYSRILCSEKGEPIRRMPCEGWKKQILQLDTPYKQYMAFMMNEFFEMASGSAVCIKREFLEEKGYFNENYKYWEDGPFFVKCTKNGERIGTAYTIDAIYYPLGGISSHLNGINPLLKGDSKYFNVTERQMAIKNSKGYKKRKIKYVMERSLAVSFKSILGIYFKYMDIFVIHLLKKVIYNVEIKRATKIIG